MDACFPPEEIVRTKLSPPRADVIIPRPRLKTVLDQAVFSRALTLISAPAGYGKTTLVSEWARSVRSAWLSLDRYDNDPVRFWGSILCALQQLNPTCGSLLVGTLPVHVRPDIRIRAFVTGLINEILSCMPEPFVLVLDDLHEIHDPLICQSLDYLLQHLPPQMHLIVATRQDPPLGLSRLRAGGQLMELRLGNLRFTCPETLIFLKDALACQLSEADLLALHARSEGWAAGLRILVDSLNTLSDESDRSAWIAELRSAERLVFDYLAEEVLNRQNPALRSFLLETSILAELTPARCTAVTGRAEAGALLEELYHRNLFLVQVSSQEQSPAQFSTPLLAYRYHTLFADFLRSRLEQEASQFCCELHARAAETETVPERVIAHYLAAKSWQPAARWIDRYGANLLVSGQLRLLQDWIMTLPEEVCLVYPRLSWLLGACAVQLGDVHNIQPDLERAAQDFETCGDVQGRGDALALLVSSAFIQGNWQQVATLIPQGLACSLSAHARIQLLMARSWLALMSGQFILARKDLEAALAVAENSRLSEAYMVLSFYLKPAHLLLPGGLEKLEHFCHQAQVYINRQPGPLRLAVDELQTFIHLWRGRLPEASELGTRMLAQLKSQGGYTFLGADAAICVAMVAAAQGRLQEARQMVVQVIERSAALPLEQTGMPAYLYLLARLDWQAGQYASGPELLARMEALVPDSMPDYPVLLQMLRGGVALSERLYRAAERFLRQAIILQQQELLSRLTASAPLALAGLLLEMDQPAQALAEIEPLLAESQRTGCAGEILKEGITVIPLLHLAVRHKVHAGFAAYLLEQLGQVSGLEGAVLPDSGETLTAREVEVVRLLAAGYSNQQIGAQLVISQSTVKTHIAHLMQKLGVDSRTQIVARARQLRLV